MPVIDLEVEEFDSADGVEQRVEALCRGGHGLAVISRKS